MHFKCSQMTSRWTHPLMFCIYSANPWTCHSRGFEVCADLFMTCEDVAHGYMCKECLQGSQFDLNAKIGCKGHHTFQVLRNWTELF